MDGSRVKVEFEKFDGKRSFTMWKVRVEDLLVQIRLDSALEDRSEEMDDKQWITLEKRTYATIRTCLVDVVLYGVLEESTQRFVVEVTSIMISLALIPFVVDPIPPVATRKKKK